MTDAYPMEEEGEGKGEGGGEVLSPFGEYEGGRDADLNRHGFGSALLPNGDVYEGEYVHGKRHGKGMYCFKNGARYSGMWKRGLKHGKGEFLYPDGSKYAGDWRQDLKHGIGIYCYPNGDTYEGCWYEGWRHGLGTYTFKSQNVSYYGTWKEGRMDGPGIYNYAFYRYHGAFEKNLPKGPGCYTFDCKYMQHGYYINMRDPKFDYLGIQELEDNNPDGTEYRGNPKGIVPIWRARSITEYKTDLLPPEPVSIPVKEEEESMLDIIDYLSSERYQVAEEEHESRITPSPVPVDLEIADIDTYDL